MKLLPRLAMIAALLAPTMAFAQNFNAPIGTTGCGTTAVQKGSGATPTIDAATGVQCVTIVPIASGGYSYAHISTATTTAVKASAGVLHAVTINNIGTVTSTTTVYDSLSGIGTVIAVINTLAGQTSYVYDVAFSTGLTVVTTGSVAPDVTVSYK